MLCIGILENSGRIARLLCPALLRNGFELIYCTDELIDIPKSSAGKALIVISGCLLDNTKSPFDIFVIGNEGLKPPESCKASVVVSPETANAVSINTLKSKSVISYGICSKNTVTVSSLIDTNLVVSIQRELVSLSGMRVDEQELAITIENENDIDPVLACIAILFLLDVPIDEIKKTEFV